MNAGELRTWMEAQDYTVRGLARALGLEPRTVQRYRDGSRPIPQVFVVALRALEREGGGGSTQP